MEVMPDHGHQLLSRDPQFGIHRLVKLLKGYSSHALREEFPALKRRLPSLVSSVEQQLLCFDYRRRHAGNAHTLRVHNQQGK